MLAEDYAKSLLLDRAADAREHVVGVRTDQTDRSNNNYQNHCQHDCVFRNILTSIILPKLLDKFSHEAPFLVVLCLTP